MIQALRTLEEVEKAVFQALKNAGIPCEDEYREYDENDIQEMRRNIRTDIIGAFTLTLSKDFYLHVKIIECPMMDIIDGKEVFGENLDGRNVKLEATMDDWDTFEITRWSSQKGIYDAIGYIAVLWRHRYGDNGQKAIEEMTTLPELTLDPAICDLLDSLERCTSRNTVCHFLESVGFLGPQLALDEPIIVNREGLLTYLLEKRANSLDKFCELVQESGRSSYQRLPFIDVPEAFSIDMHIHRKLNLHPYGLEWLQNAVKFTNEHGSRLSERQVRGSLFLFMKENRINSFDELMALAKAKHHEASLDNRVIVLMN